MGLNKDTYCFLFNQVRGVEREVEVMRGLCHRNIVQYLGCQIHEESINRQVRSSSSFPFRLPFFCYLLCIVLRRCLHIFLELVPGGSLASLLRKVSTIGT